jgi:hypothetical protein
LGAVDIARFKKFALPLYLKLKNFYLGAAVEAIVESLSVQNERVFLVHSVAHIRYSSILPI